MLDGFNWLFSFLAFCTGHSPRSALSINPSNIDFFGNAENQTWSRWARRKNVIRCAMRPPPLNRFRLWHLLTHLLLSRDRGRPVYRKLIKMKEGVGWVLGRGGRGEPGGDKCVLIKSKMMFYIPVPVIRTLPT